MADSKNSYLERIGLHATELADVMDDLGFGVFDTKFEKRDEMIASTAYQLGDTEWVELWLDTCSVDTLQDMLDSERVLLQLARDNDAPTEFIELCEYIVEELGMYEDEF